MNKTIHVSAIVLAILILTVGCQGKKDGSRAEDEGSNTVLADSTIQKYSGKATVTGSEYLDKLSEICRYSVDSLDGGGCSLDLDILESRFADEIFLDLDEDVRKDDFPFRSRIGSTGRRSSITALRFMSFACDMTVITIPLTPRLWKRRARQC